MWYGSPTFLLHRAWLAASIPSTITWEKRVCCSQRMCLMIYICGLHGVRVAAAQVEPRSLISITDPSTPAPVVPGIAPARHLKLVFHDLDAPLSGYRAPQREDIEQIIAF